MSRAVFNTKICLAVALLSSASAQAATSWPTLPDSQLELSAGRVDKTADVEALSWEVWVSNKGAPGEFPHSVLTNFVRLKFFSARGRKEHGTVVLPYGPQTSITAIAGRTVKPDGSAIELRPSEISNRSVTPADGLTTQAKSFALPSLQPGDIADYQWTEDRRGELADHVRLPVQLRVPVEQVRYHIRPLRTPSFDFPLQLLSFHCAVNKLETDADGSSRFTMTDVPAFHEEPLMPPEDQIKKWVLLYYGAGEPYSGNDYWGAVGRNFYDAYKPRMIVDAPLRRVAANAAHGAASPEDKLAKLVDYCRKNIKQVYGDQTWSDDRLNAKRDATAAETLAAGQGTSFEINLAFAALATAAGFDARLARVSDRGDVFFDKTLLTPYFLNYHQVAVKMYGKWLFYDPADRRLPSGMLRWQEEGVDALITDPVKPVFIRTPITGADQSKIVRSAQFTMHPDGTLEGFVREVFNGQAGLKARAQYVSDSVSEREQQLRDGLQQRFPAARVLAARLSLPESVAEGARFSYRIEIPGYAAVAGKQIQLAPAFFEAGMPRQFPGDKREHPVYFHYPWSEFDSVRIKLPDGYELDPQSKAPGEIQFAPGGCYRVRMYVSGDNELIYEREFSFGTDGTILFPPEHYGPLKKLFDEVWQRDGERVTLTSPSLAASVK